MSEDSKEILTLKKDAENNQISISRELLESSIILSLKSRRQNEKVGELNDATLMEDGQFNLTNEIDKEIKVYTDANAKRIRDSDLVVENDASLPAHDENRESTHRKSKKEKKPKKEKKEKKKHKKKNKKENIDSDKFDEKIDTDNPKKLESTSNSNDKVTENLLDKNKQLRSPSRSRSLENTQSSRSRSSVITRKIRSRNYRHSIAKSSSPEIHSPSPRCSPKSKNSKHYSHHSPVNDSRSNKKIFRRASPRSPLRKYSRSRSPRYNRHRYRSRSRSFRSRKRHGQRSRSSSYDPKSKRSRRSSSSSSRSSSNSRYKRSRNRSRTPSKHMTKMNRSEIRRHALEQVVRNLKIVSIDDSGNPTLNIAEISKLQASGVSLEEITDICHVIAQEQHQNKQKEKENFTKSIIDSLNSEPSVKHPFQTRPATESSEPVTSTAIPVKPLDEKQLSLTFPVSAGVEHRDEELKNNDDDDLFPKRSLPPPTSTNSVISKAFTSSTLVKPASTMKICLSSCTTAVTDISKQQKTAIVTPTVQSASNCASTEPRPVPPPTVDKTETSHCLDATPPSVRENPTNKPCVETPMINTVDIPLPPEPSSRSNSVNKVSQSSTRVSTNPPALFVKDSSLPSVFPAYSQLGTQNVGQPQPPVTGTVYHTAPFPPYCVQYPNQVTHSAYYQDHSSYEDERPHYDTKQIPGLVPEKDPIITLRELDEQPKSWDALLKLHHIKQKLESSSNKPKFIPGKFTGKPMLKPMSIEEHNSGYQAWVKKDFFSSAPAVQCGVGLSLLKKMGWKDGEGLGKNNEGSLIPLALDFKTDRRGLASFGESHSKKSIPIGPVKPRINNLPVHVGASVPVDLASGKHPVSVLMEYCKKCKMNPPSFDILKDEGPAHDKHFLMSVSVNGVQYVPATSSRTKKDAKATAAQCALEGMGLVLKAPLNTNPS